MLKQRRSETVFEGGRTCSNVMGEVVHLFGHQRLVALRCHVRARVFLLSELR